MGVFLTMNKLNFKPLFLASALVLSAGSCSVFAQENAADASVKIDSAEAVDKASTVNLSIAHDADEVSAHDVVKSVTESVLAMIHKSQNDPQYDQATLSSQLDALLTEVVDFNFIALNVMGVDNARSISREEFDRFASVFKQNLISTYAKGMTSFSDFNVEVIPPENSIEGQRNVTVRQKVEAPTGTSLVTYTMAVNKSGQWVLRNMNINGINLGVTFRDQFRVALKQNDGDVKKVIDNWDV